MTPSILQVGACCAGVPQLLADASGGTVLQFTTSPHPFGYAAEREITLPGLNNHLILSQYLNIFTFKQTIRNFDTIHFHSNSMLPGHLDLPLWQRQGKEILLHLHGSEIRGRLNRAAPRGADRVLVSTPDLLKHCPGAEWIPHPVKIPDTLTSPQPTQDHDTLRVLHAPSDPEKKGTPIIRRAIDQAQRAGVPVAYREITHLPHSEVIKALQWADVVIDQIRPDIGCYGAVSVEAMLAGRPVVCYLSGDYAPQYRGCPILSPRFALRDALAADLSDLHDNPAWRRELGRLGQDYVIRVHDVDRIVRNLYGGQS